MKEEDVFKFQGEESDFIPIYAIVMAINPMVINVLKKKISRCEEINDEISRSVLNGLLNEEELKNFKLAYKYLRFAQKDDSAKEVLENIWKVYFSGILAVAKEFADYYLHIELKEYTERTSVDMDMSYIYGLCCCGILSKTKEIVDKNDMRTDFFGPYLEIFAKDCDIDKVFHRFFDIPNTKLYKRYCLRCMQEGKVFSELHLDFSESNNTFDVYLKEIFVNDLIKRNVNPHTFRIAEKKRKKYTDDKALIPIDDIFVLNNREKQILEKVKCFLDKESESIRYSERMQEKERHEIEKKTTVIYKKCPDTERENQKLKLENQLLKQRMQELEGDTRKLATSLKELTLKQDKLKKENSVLEETIFELSQAECIEPIMESEIDDEVVSMDLSQLYHVKGVFIGGHINSINRLKKLLPSWGVIDTNDAAKGNWSLLKDADIVVIQTRYLSHKVYYQAMNAIPDKSKIVFNKQYNISQILHAILEKLMQEQ